MNDYSIPVSKQPVTRQIIVSGILVLLACTLMTLFFDKLVSSAPGLQDLLLLVLWITLPLLWLGGSTVAYRSWPKTRYVLTNDSLRAYKSGMFGASDEQLYRYDTILSAASSSRAHGAYGTITLTLAQLEPIVMQSVARPEEQAKLIKERVAASQPASPVSL